MKNQKLDKWEIEDLEDCLFQFEKKYGIYFTQEELNSIESIEGLTEIITRKVSYSNVNDCTTQQAFYKLKNILIELNSETSEITPDTKLKEIFPRKNRIKKVREMENKLGFKINILEPRQLIISFLFFISISVIIFTFFKLTFGILSGIILFFIYRIVFKYGKEFNISTVGELAEKMTMENYFKSRRNPQTINKEEFKYVVLDWFSDRMNIKKEELKSAKLV